MLFFNFIQQKILKKIINVFTKLLSSTAFFNMNNKKKYLMKIQLFQNRNKLYF